MYSRPIYGSICLTWHLIKPQKCCSTCRCNHCRLEFLFHLSAYISILVYYCVGISLSWVRPMDQQQRSWQWGSTSSGTVQCQACISQEILVGFEHCSWKCKRKSMLVSSNDKSWLTSGNSWATYFSNVFYN